MNTAHGFCFIHERLICLFITLQNSPYFCVSKYARAVKQKVWNEAVNRERHALRACEARALRARKTLTATRFRFLYWFWEKNRLFCSLFIHLLWIIFTIGESRAISHTNDTEEQAQQVAVIHRQQKFSTETPLENVDWHSWASGSKKTTAKQREHRLAQRRQRRQHSDH